MKYLLLPIFLLLLPGNSTGQSAPPETHLSEAGTSAIFLRSAFAHGYRHGYEEGYHSGNIDINMGRRARTKLSDVHGSSLRYSLEFGSRKSFEAGFRDGLKAGYSDGFIGRKFRAVETLRSISTALDQNAAPADPHNLYFDQGVSAGYNRARNQERKEVLAASQHESDSPGCERSHPVREQDGAKQRAFCDGYRRGYKLGQADLIAQSPDSALSARR